MEDCSSKCVQLRLDWLMLAISTCDMRACRALYKIYMLEFILHDFPYTD